MIEIIIVSILLIFLIIITLKTRYNNPNNNIKDLNVLCYDDEYYDIPKLNILTDNKDINNIINEPRCKPILQKESNQQASRWAGSIDSQDKYK